MREQYILILTHLLKKSYIGVYYCIVTEQDKKKVEDIICRNECKRNSTYTSKAKILLEFLLCIKNRVGITFKGGIEVITNNFKFKRMIIKKVYKESDFIGEAGDIVVIIRDILTDMKLGVNIQNVKAYPQKIDSLEDNLID